MEQDFERTHLLRIRI